jgi:integrase
MRRMEIATLRWDDGDESGSVVKLPDQSIRVLGKGNKLRTVPIHPVLQECLLWAGPDPGKWVVPSDGKKGVAMDTIQAMTKRMHPVYTPHDYRRTVATSLRRNGVSESSATASWAGGRRTSSCGTTTTSRTSSCTAASCACTPTTRSTDQQENGGEPKPSPSWSLPPRRYR